MPGVESPLWPGAPGHADVPALPRGHLVAQRRLLIERQLSDRGEEDRKEGGGEGKSLAADKGELRGGEGTDVRSQQMEIPARELPHSCAVTNAPAMPLGSQRSAGVLWTARGIWDLLLIP